MDSTTTTVVVVPVAVQAFSVSCFASSGLQVAPLAQPDVSRVDPAQGPIAHDLMDQVDLSASRLDSATNTRFVDVCTGNDSGPVSRNGVYVSWCLPRMYRQAPIQDSPTTTRQQQPTPTSFRPVPNRWIVVRFTDQKPTASWIVESDRVRRICTEDFVAPSDFQNLASTAIDPTRDPSQPQSVVGWYGTLDDGYTVDEPGAKYRTEPLTVCQPGNEFFADYQPANMGVFSLLDSMDDVAAAVIVGYAVVGYHAEPVNDPLNVTGGITEQLLDQLHIALDASDLTNTQGKPSLTLCNGAVRNVSYDPTKYSLVTPSLNAQQSMNACQPVAVGTDSLDALAAFLHVQGQDTADQVLAQLVGRIAAGGVDDAISLHNAMSATSALETDPSWDVFNISTEWRLPWGPGTTGTNVSSPNAVPTRATLLNLRQINSTQAALDACHREQNQVRRQLYSAWWSAIALRDESLPSNGQGLFASRSTACRTLATTSAARLVTLASEEGILLTALAFSYASLAADVGNQKTPLQVRVRPYGRRRDPTVLVGAVPNTWPCDFQDVLPGQLASKIPDTSSSSVTVTMPPALSKAFPDIAPAASLALNASVYNDVTNQAYATQGIEDVKGAQGWFPLFVEWEVEYVHIPMANWSFLPDKITGAWDWVIDSPSELSNSLADKLSKAPGPDCRSMQGRAALAPQTGMVLQGRLRQLFEQSGQSDLATALSPELQATILQNAAALPYLSTPMGGFIDHLLTLRHGHYPRPNTKDAAVITALGLDDAAYVDVLAQLDASHTVAPYGSATRLSPGYTQHFSPFKPVTHGQARFTKLTIVDKFGQVVVGIQPSADSAPSSYPTALHPCLSPSMSIQSVESPKISSETRTPNTAIAAASPNACEYFQITPGINQPARLNVGYLTSDGRIADDWDNPIWGWLVANYAEKALQVFKPNGTLATSITIVTTDDSTTTKVVQVINETSGLTVIEKPSARLAAFIASLSGSQPLASTVLAMLGDATDSLLMASAGSNPSGGMLPAVFGRPFCLADMALSIELAAPALSDTSLLTSPSVTIPSVSDYNFPAALGNPTAAFDGVVGVFDYNRSGTLTNLAASFAVPSEDLAESGKMVAPSRQPMSLMPYFVPCDTAGSGGFSAQQVSNMSTISVIVDSTLPVNVYTGGVFPVGTAKLPGWAVEAALSKMSALFRSGPILVPSLATVTTPTSSTTASGTTIGTISTTAAVPVPTSQPLAASTGPPIQMVMGAIGGETARVSFAQHADPTGSETVDWIERPVCAIQGVNIERLAHSIVMDGIVGVAGSNASAVSQMTIS